MVAPTKRVPSNNSRNNNGGNNNAKDSRTKQIIIAQAQVRGYLVRKAYGRICMYVFRILTIFIFFFIVKKKLHRDRVALELYNTETAYVKNLEVMTEVYTFV